MTPPNWEFFSTVIPQDDNWSFTSPTDAVWIKIQQSGDFIYKGRPVGLLAEAQILPNGQILRTDPTPLYYSNDLTILYRPRPAIFPAGERRIAVRRLARTPSYSPWQISIFTSDIMGLYTPNTFSSAAFNDSVPTTFNAPAYNAATPAINYQALAANNNRQGFAITNTGAATIHLDLDAPTALAKRLLTIPAGGTYVSDFLYAGAVFCWSTTAAAQSIEVRDFV